MFRRGEAVVLTSAVAGRKLAVVVGGGGTKLGIGILGRVIAGARAGAEVVIGTRWRCRAELISEAVRAPTQHEVR